MGKSFRSGNNLYLLQKRPSAFCLRYRCQVLGAPGLSTTVIPCAFSSSRSRSLSAKSLFFLAIWRCSNRASISALVRPFVGADLTWGSMLKPSTPASSIRVCHCIFRVATLAVVLPSWTRIFLTFRSSFASSNTTAKPSAKLKSSSTAAWKRWM
jgi:hypothetical protein